MEEIAGSNPAVPSVFNTLKKKVRDFFQAKKQGFPDSETWAMDLTFARYILPRLIRFREINFGHPVPMTMDEWNTILDKMIVAFTHLSKDTGKDENEPNFSAEPYGHYMQYMQRKYKEIDEGLGLFAKYYFDLWW